MKKTMIVVSLIASANTFAADPAPTTTMPAAAPATTEQTPPAPVTPPAGPVDCNYHLPIAVNKSVDNTLVEQWATRAILQSFTFHADNMQADMDALKACFTDAGWKGFSDALDKSGNMKTIQEQKLTVSSMPNGKAIVNVLKDNQWKIILPINVTYQNDKEKLTQALNVDLLISRKPSGDLGIAQIIAAPVPATPTVEPTAPATAQ